MKILHFHTSLAGGGIEAMITGLANEMVKTDDVSVGVIFEPKNSDVFLHQLDRKVKLFSLGKKKTGISFSIIWKILIAFCKGKYDVVNIHGSFCYYVLAVILCHRRSKIFYTVHNDAVMENSKWDKKILFFKKFCFKHKWVHAITISPVSEKSFENLYGCCGSLILNGIMRKEICSTDSLACYRISSQTRLFIHAARITEQKNQESLCRVFSRLITEGEDVVLLIAGVCQDNEIYYRLQKYFSERIVYLGERSDVLQLLVNSDAMCLPSIWEGLPVVLLESLSVGCVPICSPVGGIVDVVTNGKNGLLSKSYGEDDYYKTMKEFINLSESELASFKQRCRESFAPYDIAHTAASYIETYKACIE